MPFTGFVGDWTNLKVIEDSIYDLLKDKKLFICSGCKAGK